MTRSDPPATAVRARAMARHAAGRAGRWREIGRRMADGSPSIRSQAVIRSCGPGKLRVNGTSAPGRLAGERDPRMRPGADEAGRDRVAGRGLAGAEGRDPDREPGR